MNRPELAAAPPWSLDRVQSDVIDTLKDITADWELTFNGGIATDTWIVADLDFCSIDVVELFVALEQRFGTRFPAQSLLMNDDGSYVSDLSVGELVSFLYSQLCESP